jgi:pyruvate/2-oxoglutarate dehydrogenase complex dihydrolipoamide acyltransferase (E2) component
MALLDIVVPEEIGEIEECVIVTWLKRAGDPVKQGEALLILQAEKVSYDVPAPAAGRVTELLAPQGEVVRKGQSIARLEVEAVPEPAPAGPVAPPAAAQVSPPARERLASPVAKRLAREHNLDLNQVAGTGDGGRITEKDVLAFMERRQAQAQPVAAPSP